MYPTAMPAISGDVFQLTDEMIEAGLEASRESPRLRIIQPIHRSQDALVQRMLNFMQPGSCLCPHLHPRESAVETVQVLRGCLGFVVFDESGKVRTTCRLSDDGLGLIDIEPMVWHGLVVLEPDTVILEIKRGPYDQERDKVFAEWAPAEEDPEANAYRESLERLFN